MGEGREGDWECSGCNNRNYAFRSFCNRCKQPRLLVDAKTPADSKWLPRIGDWICAGCTNNNYASREKCKKCGQPKEIAAMPAIAIPGATFPTYSTPYFARAPGGGGQQQPQQQKASNMALLANAALQHPLLLGADKYGVSLASTWSLGSNQISGLPFGDPLVQPLVVPKGWRNGDWMCNCGYHNYSSRQQCKSCNASIPPALGTKRLASDELVPDLENKRLNLGNKQTNGQQQTYPAFDQVVGSIGDARPGVYAPFSNISPGVAPNWQATVQFPQATAPALLGKGAKQWRDGDWMCTNCNNHNYASRSECNRCKTQRDAVLQPVNTV